MRDVAAVVQRSVHTVQLTIVVVVAGELHAVTAVTVDRSWDASGSFARTSSRSVFRAPFRQCFPYSPPAVGFGPLRWSVAWCNFHDVQLSCLFEPHAVGDNFFYRTLPSLPRVFSQGNLYVGGPRKVNDLLRQSNHEKTLSMRFCLFVVQLTVL